jgi:hypothetical protein
MPLSELPRKGTLPADPHRQHKFPKNFAKKVHSIKTGLRFKASEVPINTFTYSHVNIQISSFPE